MQRLIIGPANYQPKPTRQPTPHKAVLHGPPRPFHAGRKGKGGQETRPPVITVGTRQWTGDETERTALLNTVADAATRHGISIPSCERILKHLSVAANVEELRRQIAKLNAKEEALQAERERREQFAAQAKASRLLFCGKCQRAFDPTAKAFAQYKAHKEDCPERTALWVLSKELREQWRQLRIVRSVKTEATQSPQDAEASLTKDDLGDQFNASDLAIIESKQNRVHYRRASEYSDDHQ